MLPSELAVFCLTSDRGVGLAAAVGVVDGLADGVAVTVAVLRTELGEGELGEGDVGEDEAGKGVGLELPAAAAGVARVSAPATAISATGVPTAAMTRRDDA